jgi:hypothetical protein
MSDIVWDDEQPSTQNDIVWDDMPSPDAKPAFDVRKQPLYRIGRGALSQVEGLAQLAAHTVPGLDAKAVDQYVNEQAQSDKEANPGFDPYNMLGVVGSPLNLALATKIPAVIGASKSFGSLGKMAKTISQSIPTGYALGAINPVVDDLNNYVKHKMYDVGTGAAINTAIPAALNVAEKVASGVGSIASAISGGGGDSVKLAWEAGKKGGRATSSLQDYMRGAPGATQENLVEEAKSAVYNLKKAKSNDYVKGMSELSKDSRVIPLNKIENAVSDAVNMKKFEGVDLAPSLDPIRQEISSVFDMWKKLPADKFHTPSGIDGLKQRIGDIRDRVGTSPVQRAMVDKVYNAITTQVKEQAPNYAKTMESYQSANNVIKEIEKGLSLGNTATTDAGIRKLSSALKNDYKEGLVNKLGDPNLKYKLAGNNLKHIEPTGIGKMAALSSTGLGLYAHSPSTAAFALTQMPRVMGELSLLGGKTDRLVSPIVSKGLQSLLLQQYLRKDR